MRNEEAIAYWSQHGTVPSPESQAATMTAMAQQIEALQAQVAALQAKPARRRRSVPPLIVEQETATTGYAIDGRAMETTTRLLALPELMELSREQIYAVVEAYQRGCTSRQIREELRWGTGKYNTIIKPVVAALMRYGNDAAPLPQHGNAQKPATATRQRTGNGVAATQKRKVVTQ